jgi:hypothetical protein
MKYIVYSITFLFFSLTAFSQSDKFYVTGRVVNAENKAPLQGATVFADNTTLGTTTDPEGKFVLALPNGGYDLVISFIGFATESKRISMGAHTDLLFELSQKEKTMEAVVIGGTGEVKDGWEKYGTFFLEQFIGKTNNSEYCQLKNKEAVKFYYSKRRNRLKILASEPLVIDNKALGYTIRYDLDSFTHEYNTQVSLYTGYPLFEEKEASSETERARWMEARQKAYRGSVLHFMRSVFDRRLDEEGFEIQFVVKINESDSALHLKNFYAALNYKKDDSTQTVQVRPNQQQVGVIYRKEKPAAGFLKENPDEPSGFQFSILSFQRPITIEQNGYYHEQNDITTNAYWTWDKVADALPYDYIYVP